MGVAARAFPASNESLHIDNSQPPPIYPIGQTKGPNAKVAGRLFNIDGRVEYFAGARLIAILILQTGYSHDFHEQLSNLGSDIGTNAWWLAHLSENSDIDITLSEIAKVCPFFLEQFF